MQKPAASSEGAGGDAEKAWAEQALAALGQHGGEAAARTRLAFVALDALRLGKRWEGVLEEGETLLLPQLVSHDVTSLGRATVSLRHYPLVCDDRQAEVELAASGLLDGEY